MPRIISSTALRNGYNDISTFCHNEKEPIFITKNGQGDLALMSIEQYEELISKAELYKKIEEGLSDLENGKVKHYKDIRAEIMNG